MVRAPAGRSGIGGRGVSYARPNRRKKVWGLRVTTVFPGEGYYVEDSQAPASYSTADVSIDRIGDLLNLNGQDLTAGHKANRR